MRPHPSLRRGAPALLLAAALAACAPDAPTSARTRAGDGPLLHTAIFQKPTKTATGYWERGLAYDWTLDKTVSPAGQEVGPGSTATFDYTLTATRLPATGSETVGVRGQICVKNLGSAESQGMTIRDNVQASTNGGATWNTIKSQDVDVSANPVVSPAETACFAYDVAFTPVPGALYRNEGAVTWTNAGNGGVGDPGTTQTWETAFVPFTLPAEPTTSSETDEAATLADLLTCPAGFSCTPSSGGWSLTGSQVITYAVQVTNVGAPCGHGATVRNAAALTETDSGTGHADSAQVSVTTPECSPSLRIAKVADVTEEEAGNPIGFSVTVTSDGPGTARGVTLSDPLPAGTGISWSIAAGTGCTITANTLSCSFGDMAAGTSRTVHVTSPTTEESCAAYPNTASAQATNHAPVTATALVTVKCAPPPVGIHGCTPGYWKQRQHFGSWTGYVPTGPSATRYNTAFGVNLFSSATTLLEALGTGGGGAKRFGRHSSAALLNAANSQVQFGMTRAQVISAVQAAVASGNLDALADKFEQMNERGCPLGRAE